LKQDSSRSHWTLLGYIFAAIWKGAVIIQEQGEIGCESGVILIIENQCLLPLANTPLIEYTLEFLANAGVEEVFLYGGAHSDKLEKYLK